MVRISKQSERRSISPRKRKLSYAKTGSRKDNLTLGYKEHPNAVEGSIAKEIFIPKIK